MSPGGTGSSGYLLFTLCVMLYILCFYVILHVNFAQYYVHMYIRVSSISYLLITLFSFYCCYSFYNT